MLYLLNYKGAILNFILKMYSKPARRKKATRYIGQMRKERGAPKSDDPGSCRKKAISIKIKMIGNKNPPCSSKPTALFGRLAELAEYVDSDAIDEAVNRCPSKVQ